ncbi:Uncharacterized protein ALO77_01927 [Pseudomonas coronafaciens pv. garcae]|nr:Uncharacterized protein ALO77_01927 [Pseudomonas coronafaciens pv. garcae]RMS92693.1 hypothetical protein ALP57_02123 [Pseudomonas coronafaciens pv. oryzae]RMV85061.1 hypothetical protein ALP02_00081 [Pseudomonas coronafaciens pv. garcae]
MLRQLLHPASEKTAMYKDYPAAYQVSKGAALQVDTAFYERIRADAQQRTLVEQFDVPIRTGRAWKVRAGQVFRITTPVGPQVGDFNVWNAMIHVNACGRRARVSCKARMSALMTGYGRTCRF